MEDSFGSNYDAHRRLVSFGRPLVEKKAEAVKAALRGAWRTTTPKGTRLVVFQGVALSSDAAEALGEEADIVVGFSYEMDGGSHKLRLSTRSHTGYDVGALAKHYGGSGHVAAAGLSVHFEYDDWEVDGAVGMATQHPYAAVRDLILAFEER
jgi:nanoRNase/pAp phosphatase (c-di-AMP/oligoRNAs hydrolase)